MKEVCTEIKIPVLKCVEFVLYSINTSGCLNKK